MDGPNWLAALESADAIVLGGGNPLYLSYWLRASGLAERLPSVLERKVYLGISAGSMVAGKSLRYDPETLQKTGVYRDDEYDDPAPLGYASAETLALANLVIRPHMGNEYFPNATFENMQIAAGQVDCPLYAIDDMTAVQVVEDQITVVSEGMWKKY
jgi:dipeptidase E